MQCGPVIVPEVPKFPSTWIIDRATAADGAAIRLLLPAVDALLDEPTVLVATLPDPRRVVAAGAVWPVAARANPTAVPCAIHVGGPWRRLGIGAALVAAMSEIAREWGAQALCSRAMVVRGSPEHEGWQRLGFADSAVMRSYSADIAALFGRHMELYDWCVASGRVPAGARTFRPGPEHADSIARLNAESLGGMAWHMLEGFRAAAGTASDVSLAVADGEQIAGFILTRAISPDTLHVHAHVIAPAYREGWAQAMLHHDFMHLVTDAGYRRFNFEVGDAHPVTRKTARRVGATLLAERTTMVQAFTVSSPSDGMRPS